MKTIELPKPVRTEAIASLRRYFEEDMPEPLGELGAGLLLDYFVEEVGPAIYNSAVADAQARMEQQLADLGGELYADPLQYWPRAEARRRNRR